MADVAIACHDLWKSYRRYEHRSQSMKERILTRRSRYEEFWALKGVELEVPTGSTLGIIGSNGSGKSTLLKVIARILTPNRGSVDVDGSVSALLELGVGFHPELTGRENVYLSGSLIGRSRREIDRRYDEVVEFAGIHDFMDMAVKNYSSGMHARLAFAVAVSVDPDILLVDEVLAVGDENFQMRCHERMTEFRKQGRTIVIVSHSLESIRHLCERAAWMDGGVLKELGETHDVLAAYLSQVHGTIEQPPTSTGRRLGSGEALITDAWFFDAGGAEQTSFRPGEAVTVRVRYQAPSPVTKVMCCIAVYRVDDLAYVIGRSSREHGESWELSGEGMIEFTVAALPLLPGSYVVSLGLQHENLGKVFDWHDRAYPLSVIPDPALPVAAGVVHVDGTWSITPATMPVRSTKAG